MTNSHCTEKLGQSTGTRFYQAYQSSGTRIGLETVDPPFRGEGRFFCSLQRDCRYSDSAFVGYDTNVSVGLGKIARVSNKPGKEITPKNPLPVVGKRTDNSQLYSGRIVEKVGKTTGVTAGKIIQTCFKVRQKDTDKYFVCQYQANANSESGDSGSPVYTIESTGVRISEVARQGYRKVTGVESGMTEVDVPKLLTHFADLSDPRKPRGVRHKLLDIVSISILAVICGANTYSQIHQYALAQEAWLSSFLELPSGVPSQDTFERVFALLSPDVWHSRFLAWTQTLVLPELPKGEDEVLAVDGKTARRSHRKGLGALHTVSVWSSQFEVVLVQKGVPDKTNEITVIPELLEVVNPAGAVVTTDAMGTQKQIAWTIREHHAHYVLALKDNHPTLFEETKDFFAYAGKVDWALEHSQTTERGHGRVETRECWVSPVPEWLHEREAWRGLSSLVKVHATRTLEGNTSEHTRYFLSSLPLDAARALRAARFHWGIENALHWVLDVAFDEDSSRAHIENAQASWVALRHLAINLLKRDKTVKAGVEAKRLRAGWDRAYLLKLLQS